MLFTLQICLFEVTLLKCDMLFSILPCLETTQLKMQRPRGGCRPYWVHAGYPVWHPLAPLQVTIQTQDSSTLLPGVTFLAR